MGPLPIKFRQPTLIPLFIVLLVPPKHFQAIVSARSVVRLSLQKLENLPRLRFSLNLSIPFSIVSCIGFRTIPAWFFSPPPPP
jgi:hypothetical protein